MADDAAVAESASACVNHGSAVGMPQLCPDWMANQVVWLVLALIAIFFILSKIALPRIAAVLAERNGTITNDLAAAEDLKRQAVAAEEGYTRALAEARAEAQRISTETRASIQADLDKAIAAADAQIAEKAAESERQIADIRAGAAESVAQVARDVAGDIIAALGGSGDKAAIDAAVDAAAKKV